MEQLIKPIAQALKIKPVQVEKTLELLASGNTVPFIARYRKEVTGALDEEQIRVIEEQYTYQKNLLKRKEDVMRLIEQQGKLTEDIVKELEACEKLSQVEDIYRPYQQKRKTRASDAIAKGLKPFAMWMLELPYKKDVEKEALNYVNDQVKDAKDAIQGAKDIIAEIVSDDAKVRGKVRQSMETYGKLVTKEKKKHEDDKKVYKMYYDYQEKVTTLASHRIMAIDRGEKEKVLQVSIDFNEDYLLQWTLKRYLKNRMTCAQTYIEEAIQDGLKRLVYPSVEREIRNELTQKAQEQSIDVFSMNLERLLLQAPMKNKTILGFDPAFRTGCKLAVIDHLGKMLQVSVIYPHQPNAKIKEAKEIMKQLIQTYQIELIAIGNGTASRESEKFVAEFLKEYHMDQVAYTLVSEAGASVYSASKLAKEEFPDLHVEQRSAISIARRIMDPLSELIKIDPQSIGVGQYQHDLPTARLKDRLSFVVSKAVNRVGVNVNTASVELLKNVSGLNGTSAKAIVTYREENGALKNRKELKKVPKIGAKSFEQAAGFLRIEDGDEFFDRTSIHPESYAFAKALMKKCSLEISDLGSDKAKELLKLDLDALSSELACDKFTLEDIIQSLCSPLRDYRDNYDGPMLRSDVLELSDLHIGDQLEGIVRNVVDFGAFVDIGLHEDGLVHISKMSKQRVSHPSEIVNVGDVIKVWVYNIDMEKEKVQLSLMKP